MLDTDLLILWFPGRQLTGALEAEFAKRGLRAMLGAEEREAREHYRPLPGLLLSVVGWQGEWGTAGVALPATIHGLLDGLVAAHPEGFEAIVWNDAPTLEEPVPARRDLLHGPWQPGTRYQVFQ